MIGITLWMRSTRAVIPGVTGISLAACVVAIAAGFAFAVAVALLHHRSSVASGIWQLE